MLKVSSRHPTLSEPKVKYLGHIIGQGVIKHDPAKIQAIADMLNPENAEDLCRLLEMATYLSKFCSKLSDITAPLSQLTKKGALWAWGNYRKFH